MQKLFDDEDFQFGLETVLGAAGRGAADIGEVLATAARIEDGDADSWLDQWTATAGAAWAAAKSAAQEGHRGSARSRYQCASSYYAAALYLIAASEEPERRLELWRRQRQCWDRAVELFPVPGERIAIPFEGGTLPGYFFRAPGAEPGARRPLVVLNNGSDGSTSQMWVQGGAAAAERGYHWMTFDGPGQQSTLLEAGLPFRPDWEAVLTPVADAMTARADVEPGRMVVIGISQGGFWVSRALCFEHRFAAAVVDPGVVDVSSAWTSKLSEPLRRQLREGRRREFDREMRLAEVFSPKLRAQLGFRGDPYGVRSGSRYELFQAVEKYRLGAEVAQITTPLLITDPEEEQFWPGQSRQLHDRLPGVRELIGFAASEGAGRHCEPLSGGIRDARIFDWLDRYLGRGPCAG
jgi:hypothetical protein